MPNVKANRVADFDSCKQPGDFFLTEPSMYEKGMRRLSFLCPCGCGDLCGIRVRNDGQNIDGAWGWDRNEDAPTCTPSIDINPGSGHWHGHLKAGVFEPC